jgi:hypothetical protein
MHVRTTSNKFFIAFPSPDAAVGNARLGATDVATTAVNPVAYDPVRLLGMRLVPFEPAAVANRMSR